MNRAGQTFLFGFEVKFDRYMPKGKILRLVQRSGKGILVFHDAEDAALFVAKLNAASSTGDDGDE